MNKPLLHAVMFWLNPDLSSEEVENFKGFFEDLSRCSTVKSLQFGRSAPTEPRPVVDNSFTWSMVATFANQDDHDIYQADDIHNTDIEKYQNYWPRVLVNEPLIE